MTSLYVTEYQRLARDNASELLSVVGQEPGVDQALPISKESAASKPFRSGTKFVRVNPDMDCHVSFGEEPEATQQTKLIVRGQVEFFGVLPGQRVAVVIDTSW